MLLTLEDGHAVFVLQHMIGADPLAPRMFCTFTPYHSELELLDDLFVNRVAEIFDRAASSFEHNGLL